MIYQFFLSNVIGPFRMTIRIFAGITLCIGMVLSGCDGHDTHTGDHELEHEHGVVEFSISCNEEAQEEFLLGLAHLHHMMYSQARPHFEASVQADKNCAMAHWGIAKTAFQPLWAPSSDEDMERGKEASERALEIGAPTEKEQEFIEVVNVFFSDSDTPVTDRASDFEARIFTWMEASRELYETYSDDVDAAAFYALSEVAYAMTQFSPHQERDFTRERRAGELMEQFLEDYPEHPGLFHYLIHAYDNSELAHKADEVARQYDQLAPDTPHALHMPTHIFVRLGLWEDTAEWNERSAEAALRNPFNGLTSLHYPHALDYVMYAYLQLEEYEKASETLDRVLAIEEGQPHFGTAYGIAAPQARYFLEQQMWEEAAQLEPNYPEAIEWENYPGATALFNYARGLGAARSGNLDQARYERDKITEAVEVMRDAGNVYWSYMTEALGKAIYAWVLYEEGETETAITLMDEAAELEESMDKHPITPGEVFPVRELHAEILLLEGQMEEARIAFEKSLERTPNRRNAQNGMEEAIAVN